MGGQSRYKVIEVNTTLTSHGAVKGTELVKDVNNNIKIGKTL